MERNKDSGVNMGLFFVFFLIKEKHYFCSSDDVEANGRRKMHAETNC